MKSKSRKIKLDRLYVTYNRREYVHPDPLECIYAYDDIKDREIAGMVASALAYGRVRQILKSVSYILDKMNPSPYLFLQAATRSSMRKTFKGFCHRFAKEEDVVSFLVGIKQAITMHGSLNSCFLAGMSPDDQTIIPALTFFANQITSGEKSPGHLVPRPERGSACKRLNLFLRWMVRKDDVDPGGWEGVPRSKLVVPIDTHMHRIGIGLGFTIRKQADMATALEITAGLREYEQDDPVKYDFALTRTGIRDDIPMTLF